MEQVQIMGGGNGIYLDAKGRQLYTMGDYSPAVGDWVWTNGTTIYGHQSGGEQPTLLISDDAVLPFTDFSSNLRNFNSSCVSDFNFGSDENFEQLTNEKISGYVGNRNTAYVAIPVEGSKPKWYRVNDGAYIGAFDLLDATVDDNGDMISAESGSSYFTDHSSNPHIKWQTTPFICWHKYNGFRSHWGCCVATEWAHGADEQENVTMKIRRNSKIINALDLQPFLQAAKSKALAEAEKIHNSGDGSGDDLDIYTFYTGTEKRASYGDGWGNDYLDDIEIVHQGKRERPNCYVRTASAYMNWLKVNKDGTYFGVFSVYADADSFPWLSRTIYLYPLDEKTGVVCGRRTKRCRDWLQARNYVQISYFVENGHTTKIEESNYMELWDGAFLGEILETKKDSEEETKPDSPKSFRPLNGYDIKSVKVTAAESGKYITYYIFGMHDYGVSAEFKTYNRKRVIWNLVNCGRILYINSDYNNPVTITKTIADSWVQLKGTSRADLLHTKAVMPINHITFNGRFSGKLQWKDTWLSGITLYDGNEQIITLNSSNFYGTHSNWYSWRIAAEKGMYFCFPTYGYGFFIKDKKPISNYYDASISNTFSGIKFKSKKKLKRLLSTFLEKIKA